MMRLAQKKIFPISLKVLRRWKEEIKIPWGGREGECVQCCFQTPWTVNRDEEASQRPRDLWWRPILLSTEELKHLNQSSMKTSLCWLHYLCFSCVRDWLHEGVHKSIFLTQLLNSSTNKNKWETEVSTQGIPLMQSGTVTPEYGTTNIWFLSEKILEVVPA